jgi:hypothetical protein
LFQLVFFCVFWISPGLSQAQVDRRQQCVQAYESGQRLKKSGELVEAASRFAFCANEICPSLMREDCATRLSEVKEATPAISLSVEFVGEPAPVRASVDGHARAWASDSPNLIVNPGRHELRVEADGFPSQTLSLLLGEGERIVRVTVRFDRKSSPESNAELKPEAEAKHIAKPPQAPRSTPTAAIIVTSSSLIGAGGFVYFGVMARHQESELEGRCAPSCTKDEVSDVKRTYLLANLSLGLGVASLLTGAALFLVHAREAPPDEVHSARIAVDVGPGTLGVHGAF